MGRVGRIVPMALAVLLAACGDTSSAATEDRATAASVAGAVTTSPSTSSTTNPIVGRWMQVHTCDQLVAGLEEFGLGEIAPAVVGDYFPDASPEELATKDDLCSGAKPQRHFHFFDAAGAFGSLDQHQQQVDDGAYAVDGATLRIGDGAWRFAIDGDRLSLVPLITKAQTNQALAKPFDWSTAGWIVAVAYPGSTWQRVPCDGWC